MTELPTDELDRVIRVDFKARRHGMAMGECPHLSITIDEELAQIQCSDCEKLLNPVTWIRNHMSLWRRTFDQINGWRRLLKAMQGRDRFKCVHCNRFSRALITRGELQAVTLEPKVPPHEQGPEA